MRFYPTLETAREYAADGRYDIMPVSCELLSDICTPIEAVKILKNISTHCYLLESAEDSERWGRWSFLGFEPKSEITCGEGKITIDGMDIECEDPTPHIRRLLSQYRSPRIEGLPPFTGGLVGYFAYEFLGYTEPTIQIPVEDSEQFKNADLMLFGKVIAFDNYRGRIVLIANMKLSELETGYNKACLELRQMADLLQNGRQSSEPAGRLQSEVKALFTKEEYCEMVEKAKHYIIEGDIFQIVLSNRLHAEYEGSLLNTYRILRTSNPSPYMFYFSGTDVEHIR